MASQRLDPIIHGLVPESEPFNPDSELVNHVWAEVLAICKNSNCPIDTATDELVKTEKANVELAKLEAERSRKEFVEILQAWDKEHDRNVGKGVKRSRTLLKNKNDLTTKVRSNILDKHSWKEVFDEMGEAKEAYDNPTGLKAVHKWLRKTADKSSFVEPFVEFIPNSDFSSVVCGGIKFILKACMAAKKFRDEVFELIEQLPEKVDIASQYLELYHGEAELQIYSRQLFCNLLSAIQSIMYWLMKDHTFEWLKPLFKQGSYSPLGSLEKIQEVRRSSSLLERTIELCDRKRLSKIANGVDHIHQDTAWMRNAMAALMRDWWQQAKWFRSVYQHKEALTRQSSEHEQEAISQKELLSLFDSIDIDDGSINEPILNQVLRAGFNMDEEAQKRVEWLMGNENVSRWFTSAKSQKLLVNGRGSFERLTPTSFFCAMMLHSLKPIGSIILLSYFCGLQTPEEYMQHSAGKMRSSILNVFLHQLLIQWKFPSLSCLQQSFVRKLKSASPNWSLQKQRHLLRLLATTLPPSVPIFIIIDGASYYKDEEIEEVVAELSKLLSPERVQAIVKVLITVPTQPFDLGDSFEEDEIVNIPEDMNGFATKFGDSMLRLQFDSKAEGLQHSLRKTKKK